MQSPEPTILDTICSLRSAEEADTAYILAAAINLYSECIRRKGGRVLYVPDDIPKLLGIIEALLEITPTTFVGARQRRTEPTEEETKQILEPTFDFDEQNIRRDYDPTIPIVEPRQRGVAPEFIRRRRTP